MKPKVYGKPGSYDFLPRSKPQHQLVSPSSILNFLHRIEEEELELHSLMIVRNGHVVTEGWWAPYQPETPHLLNSLSKSFTSTAIGMAVAEGLLSLDDSVISFFPEEVTPSIERNMASVKVRHLLSMSTGHVVDTTPAMVDKENWVKAFLEIPIVQEPGTTFLYNTGATYMLSAIIHKATGSNLLDFLEPRLFQPLGMSGITSMSCPRGIHVGGFGMSIRTEDIAKLGLLYLQKGIWNGQRILQEQWVEEATVAHVSNGTDPNSDWAQGYGFQFWRCQNGAYRGDGAFGQFCIVIPEKNAVIAMTAGLMEMQYVLDCVWEHLLPGFLDGKAAEEPAEQLELKLNALAYLAPILKKESPEARKWHGKTYKVAPNEVGIKGISFHFYEEEFVLTLADQERWQQVQVGNGFWKDGDVTISGASLKVKASGTWRRKNSLELTLRFVETPYCDTWICHFVNDSVKVSTYRNVWIMPGLSGDAFLPTLTGFQFEDRDMWIGNGIGREKGEAVQ